jgi:hypothetical protein
MTVRLGELGDREHSIADLVMLLAIVCLALVTWSHVVDAAGAPPWKLYTTLAVSMLLALASLTRHPRWAAWIRLLTGGWIIAAPYMLKFADAAAAPWAHLGTGILLVAVSIPGLPVLGARRSAGGLTYQFAQPEALEGLPIGPSH